MVAAIKYDSKVWASSVAASWAREPAQQRDEHERDRQQQRGDEAWRDLDRQLCSVAARRGALDAEELALIREAIRIQIWRPLGMVSMREYLEHRMGYGPQVAAERLRVADALEGLPMMEAALDAGELSYSAVRELTRIATCKTEEAWLDVCRGRVLRQIEEMVAEREPGDGPDAPPKPDLRPKRFSADLRPAVVARMRQAHATLDAVRGERNDYNDLLDEAFRCLLAVHAGNAGSEHGPGDGTPGARAEAHSPRVVVGTVTKCEGCGQAWQIAAGRKLALTPAELEAAECDAVHIGSLEGPPQRATSTIPPRTRKRVLQRDNNKCTVPWCRAAANIDVHHIVHRKNGGGHEPENLTSLCSGHHDAHHRGELLIEGRAPALTFRRRNEVPHVGDLSRVIEVPRVGEPHRGNPHNPHSADALLALTALGFTKHEAKTALAAAFALVSPDAGLDPLLRAALRELR